jgi:hypothetical protein
MDTFLVRVWPDNTQQQIEEESYSYMSDDYEIRVSSICDSCSEVLQIHYNEPFASCSCKTQEWYFQ